MFSNAGSPTSRHLGRGLVSYSTVPKRCTCLTSSNSQLSSANRRPIGSAVGLPPIGKLVAALIILCTFGVLQDFGSNVVGSTSIPSVVVQS
jgi:hypothetical protein